VEVEAGVAITTAQESGGAADLVLEGGELALLLLERDLHAADAGRKLAEGGFQVGERPFDEDGERGEVEAGNLIVARALHPQLLDRLLGDTGDQCRLQALNAGAEADETGGAILAEHVLEVGLDQAQAADHRRFGLVARDAQALEGAQLAGVFGFGRLECLATLRQRLGDQPLEVSQVGQVLTERRQGAGDACQHLVGERRGRRLHLKTDLELVRDLARELRILDRRHTRAIPFRTRARGRNPLARRNPETDRKGTVSRRGRSHVNDTLGRNRARFRHLWQADPRCDSRSRPARLAAARRGREAAAARRIKPASGRISARLA
jgi:hypothetical protein